MRRPTVLALRAAGLGDLLVAVPALRTLRAALPGHRLVLAGPRGAAELLLRARLVDHVVPAGADLGSLPWDVASPDVAVNLHGRGPQSHRLLAGLHPSHLVAFASDEAGVPGPPWVQGPQPEPQRHRWARLVATSLGVAACDDATLPVEPFARECHPGLRARTVVHPGAASPARRWPADRFAAVCHVLAASGEDVLVTGARAERALVTEVVRRAGHPRVRAAPAGPVLALAAVIAAARRVVCGDTGVGHLAAAFARPSVHLMGPSDPQEWGPPPGEHRVLWTGLLGRPHAAELDAGLAAIQVADVLAALDLSARGLPQFAAGHHG